MSEILPRINDEIIRVRAVLRYHEIDVRPEDIPVLLGRKEVEEILQLEFHAREYEMTGKIASIKQFTMMFKIPVIEVAAENYLKAVWEPII